MSGDDLEHNQLSNGPAEQGGAGVRPEGRSRGPCPDGTIREATYASTSKGKTTWELKYKLNGLWCSVKTQLQHEVAGLRARAEKAIAEAGKIPPFMRVGAVALAFSRAVALLEPLKMRIDEAIELLRDCLALVQGHDLRRVAQFYVDHGMLSIRPITFWAFVDEFIKEREGGATETRKRVDVLARSLRDCVIEKVGDPNVSLVAVPIDVVNEWVFRRRAVRKYKRNTAVPRRGLVSAMSIFATNGRYWPYGVPPLVDRLGRIPVARPTRAPAR